MSISGKPGVRLALKLAFSIALLAALAWIADPRALVRELADLQPGWVIASLALAVANRVLMGVKWNALIRSIDVPVAWGDAIKAYFAASFAGIFLPPTIGADTVRTLILTRRYGNAPRIISSIIMERLIGFIVLAIFALIGIVVVISLYATIVPISASAGVVVGAIAAILVACAWLITTPIFGSLTHRMLSISEARGGKAARLASLLREIQSSLALFRTRRATLVGFFLLTGTENLVAIVRAWFVALAFGVEIGVLLFFLITPIEQFVSRLPISFHGFGLREGLFMYILAFAGVAPATGFAIGLVNHFLFIIAVLPGMWLLMSSHRPVRSA